MTQSVKDVMTKDVVACNSTTTLVDAARLMRDRGIGDVLVCDDDGFKGIVTDRDIVVRCLAEGHDMAAGTVGDVCTADDLKVAAPDMTIDDAARLMRDNAIRRLPVMEDGKAIGVISLGDLAIERDPSSALAGISAARPNG
ncbi:MAG TPA: CBS domain-containing protein [Ilumatobacteraceae bacterium]|jgi:CBS domain-containing protein